MTATDFDSFATQIYIRYQKEMIRTAYHFIRNAEDAQDIVGDCWISILQNIDALQRMSENKRRAYLLRCVRNKVVDFVRKNNRHQVNLYGIHESDIARYQEIELRYSYFTDSERDLRGNLAQMLSILPSRERTSISMKIKGFSTNAIAGMMDISPVTVRGYCYRAIKKLRKHAQNMSSRSGTDEPDA
ncbi:MAG: sigma-70 family RNA polymerase sigma factor [Clostridia bacterium]|nr:sigma-70 family RNA polymerase sigma factor [Clostridia bacterium]